MTVYPRARKRIANLYAVYPLRNPIGGGTAGEVSTVCEMVIKVPR